MTGQRARRHLSEPCPSTFNAPFSSISHFTFQFPLSLFLSFKSKSRHSSLSPSLSYIANSNLTFLAFSFSQSECNKSEIPFLFPFFRFLSAFFLFYVNMNLVASRFSSPSFFSSPPPPSSCSSFSSSCSSFDPNMGTSKKATSGCLTGILRRILCSRGLPTHPSDQIRDADSVLQTQQEVLDFKADHKTQPGSVTPTSTNATTLSAPGIVARLMGLDSMVEIPTESSAASLSRSRSMNSVQCFGECDRLQGIHRRVKSTMSFREVPGFTFLENDDNFLVLSFEGQEFESKLGSAPSKQRPKSKENRKEKVSENIMTGREKQSRKVGNEKSPRKNEGKLRDVTNIIPQASYKVSYENEYIDSEAEMFEDVLNERKRDRRRGRRRKKKPSCNCTEKKTEQECNSQETSPVSVLDFDRLQVPESDLESSGKGMSPRRKLSPELGNGQHFRLRFDANLMIEQRNVKENDEHKNEASRRREKQRQRYIYIWEEACRKAGEVVIGSNQVWKHGDCESIGDDLESGIFQHLVNELVDQLLVGH